jgi:hypothetical protein
MTRSDHQILNERRIALAEYVKKCFDQLSPNLLTKFCIVTRSADGTQDHIFDNGPWFELLSSPSTIAALPTDTGFSSISTPGLEGSLLDDAAIAKIQELSPGNSIVVISSDAIIGEERDIRFFYAIKNNIFPFLVNGGSFCRLLCQVIGDRVGSAYIKDGHFMHVNGNKDVLEMVLKFYLRTMADSLCGLAAEDEFWESITELVGSTYEKQDASGVVVMAKWADSEIEVPLLDRIPFLSEKKNFRKSLQASTANTVLCISEAEIVGYKKRGSYPKGSIMVYIKKRGCWSVRFKNSEGKVVNPNIEVINGSPRFIQQDISNEDVDKIIDHKIKFIGPKNPELIKGIIVFMKSLNKGSIAIFDTDSSAESKRLSMQCNRTKRQVFSHEMHSGFFNVDGAVLFDLEGNIHGYGAILDGLSQGGIGSRERGSRYNSTAKYISMRTGLAFGVVISDDGFFDVL